MKRAFTMVELIFIIAILGVLAAVAIPKLSATRDDAEFAKALNNFSTLVSDFTSFYTANGEISGDLSKMSNVALSKPTTMFGKKMQKIKGDTSGVFAFTVGGKNCIFIQPSGRDKIIFLSEKKPSKTCQRLLNSHLFLHTGKDEITCSMHLEKGEKDFKIVGKSDEAALLYKACKKQLKKLQKKAEKHEICQDTDVCKAKAFTSKDKKYVRKILELQGEGAKF